MFKEQASAAFISPGFSGLAATTELASKPKAAVMSMTSTDLRLARCHTLGWSVRDVPFPVCSCILQGSMVNVVFVSLHRVFGDAVNFCGYAIKSLTPLVRVCSKTLFSVHMVSKKCAPSSSTGTRWPHRKMAVPASVASAKLAKPTQRILKYVEL